MTGMPTGRLVAAVALVTAIIVAIALVRGSGEDDDAASGAGTAGEVPEGYVVFEGEVAGSRVSFIHPEEWGEVSTREGEAGAEETILEIDGGESEGTTPQIKLGVQLDSASPEAILQANIAAAQIGTEDLEVTGEEDVDVVGAVEARRAETTYTVEAASGEAEPYASVLLAASTPGETLFSLIVSDRVSDPRVDLDAVAASLRIEAASGGSDA